MPRAADDLRARRRGAERDREHAVGVERRRQRVLRAREGHVAPHVVRVELGARDPQRAERDRNLARLVLPVHQRDGPPARRAFDDPLGRRLLAAHAPDAAGAAAVIDPHGEDVLAAPVQDVDRDRVAAKCLPVAPVVGREVPGLADLHAVQERLVGIVDLPELQVCRPPGRERRGGRQGKARPIPRQPVIIGVPRFFPRFRHHDGLPCLFVELARTVAGIVARAEPPRTANRVSLVPRDDGGRDVACHHGGPHRAAGDRGYRKHALQQRHAVGRELG